MGIRAADRINDQYVQMQYLKFDLPVKKRDTVCQVLSGEAFSSLGHLQEPYKGWIL